MKKIIALTLVLTLACTLFAACGDQPEAPEDTIPTGDAAYSVSVVDGLGNPVTEGVIVRFMQGAQQISMQTVNASGVASKELPAGDYTVELKFTDADAAFYYDDSALTLTGTNRETTVTLYQGVDENSGRQLFAQGRETTAFPVDVGCTYLPMTAGERNFVMFTPSEPGKYQVSLVNSDDEVGYYGAPHFVQEQNTAEKNADGSFYVNVKASMISTGVTGTTVLVIGIDASADSCVLSIQRIGEPDRDLSDEPWHTYMPTITLQPYTHDASMALGEFDLTASTDAYTLVLGSDNYYHLGTADGPLVFMRLGKNSGGSQYLSDFQTILDFSGINKYFFDDNGEFIKKETYDQCLLEYFKYMDEPSGLYPLTEDLKYIIQMRGDHSGWFTTDGALYLFKDQNGDLVPGINSEIAWLFICCYIEQ